MEPQNQQAYAEPPPQYAPPSYATTTTGTKNNETYYKANAPPPPAGLHIPTNSQPIQTQPTIIYTNTTQVQYVQFGPYPMRYTCPNCHAQVMTETSSTPGILTYVLSGALCFLAGYCLCCLVPFCVKDCQDVEHKCPNCKCKLGLFKRI